MKSLVCYGHTTSLQLKEKSIFVLYFPCHTIFILNSTKEACLLQPLLGFCYSLLLLPTVSNELAILYYKVDELCSQPIMFPVTFAALMHITSLP